MMQRLARCAAHLPLFSQRLLIRPPSKTAPLRTQVTVTRYTMLLQLFITSRYLRLSSLLLTLTTRCLSESDRKLFCAQHTHRRSATPPSKHHFTLNKTPTVISARR